MWRLFGSVFLMLGTSIGAAMLALPVVTATHSFAVTLTVLITCWILMSAGAWALMQVCFKMPVGANLISMSEKTLGHAVKCLTWIIYLLLLYALICAYLTGCRDVLESVLSLYGYSIGNHLAAILVTFVLGLIVYKGIASVDWLNRLLMSAKLLSCLAVLLFIMPHAQWQHLSGGLSATPTTSTIMVVITAFGFAIIVPSLYAYLQQNKRQIRLALFWGSFIPLLLYIAWIAVVQACVPRLGASGLHAMAHSAHTTSSLMTALLHISHTAIIKRFSVVFIALSSLTGILSVSVCLYDFLRDGLRQSFFVQHKYVLLLLMYLPPLLILLLMPGLFVSLLTLAGAFCVYILIALPIAMWWSMTRAKMPSQVSQ